MNDIPLTFGVPDTLPALGRREIRGCFIFAAMGLFVLLVGLFPAILPPPQMALPLALCCLALPAWGLYRFFASISVFCPALISSPFTSLFISSYLQKTIYSHKTLKSSYISPSRNCELASFWDWARICTKL